MKGTRVAMFKRGTGALVRALLVLLAVRSAAVGVCSLDFVEVKADGISLVDGLEGASAAAVSPDARCLYVAGEKEKSVAVFRRPGTSCNLTWQERQHNDAMTGVAGLAGASGVAVSPDGTQVYVTGFADDALVVFDRDAASCKLSLRQILKDNIGPAPTPRGLLGARAVAVSPEGTHIYTVGERDDAVSVFARDGATDMLGFVAAYDRGAVASLNKPKSIAISPDGAHVYVAAFASDAVLTFTRSSATGQLSSPVTYTGFAGLNGATSVALSMDGANVYVAGNNGNAVSAFSRDQSTGQLTALATFAVGNGPSAVIVNPNTSLPGGHVYVALGGSNLEGSNKVSAYRRNVAVPSPQALWLEDSAFHTTGTRDGLGGAMALAVSPDTECLYVAAAGDNAVAVLNAFDATGVACDDHNGCTGPDGCDGAGACISTPLAAGTACTDNNDCTLADQCDGTGACSGACDVGAVCPGCTMSTCEVFPGNVCGCVPVAP